MRPIRTIAPLAIGLVALALAGCQRPSDPTTTATPTPTSVEQATPGTTPTRHPMPPPTPAPKANPTPDPGLQTVVGLWPVKTLAQASELQDSVDAGHQPWLLSAESVSVAYAQGDLHLFAPYAERVGPGAYDQWTRVGCRLWHLRPGAGIAPGWVCWAIMAPWTC